MNTLKFSETLYGVIRTWKDNITCPAIASLETFCTISPSHFTFLHYIDSVE